MIRLDSYFKNIQIKNIDFLKTDIEEYDYFALKGLGNLLLNCKYIQFELGIGAPYNGDVVKNDNYYDLLENFQLFIVKDENNPIWKKKISKSDLIVLNQQSKKLIELAQKKGIGFNIFCLNKKLTSFPLGLTKGVISKNDLINFSFFINNS